MHETRKWLEVTNTPDTNDQRNNMEEDKVDVVFDVEEQQYGNIIGGFSYSQFGFSFNFNISINFLDNSLGLKFLFIKYG